MFETSMVAILVAAMCALIREYGGFDALLAGIHKVFKGRKGGQFGMGLLVGTMDIATANNTVAIVMAESDRKGYGGKIWDHTEKSSFDTGYIFMCFSGDHSLWSTDAGCDICGE